MGIYNRSKKRATPKKRKRSSRTARAKTEKKRVVRPPKRARKPASKKKRAKPARPRPVPKKKRAKPARPRAPVPKKRRPKPARPRAAATGKFVPKKKRAKKLAKPARPRRLSRQTRGAVTRYTARLLDALLAPEKSRSRKQKEEIVRSKRALRGILERAGFSEASIRARLGWITRHRDALATRVTELVAAALPALDPGDRSREAHTLRRAHVTRNSAAFRRYIEDMADEGYDYDTAVDYWFSPEAE